jgi:hypothetical protein
MKTVLFAILGFFGGIFAGYIAGIIWAPGSYEDVIPLICIGVVVGPIVGIVLARRGPKAPPADTGSR